MIATFNQLEVCRAHTPFGHAYKSPTQNWVIFCADDNDKHINRPACTIWLNHVCSFNLWCLPGA